MTHKILVLLIAGFISIGAVADPIGKEDFATLNSEICASKARNQEMVAKLGNFPKVKEMFEKFNESIDTARGRLADKKDPVFRDACPAG